MEKAEIGDRLLIESEHVGVRAREGEVLEVRGAGDALHYLVRWDDGHTTTIFPSVGSVAIVRRGRKAASR